MSDKFDYRPGLVFYSPYTAYAYIVRPRKDIFSADGTVIDTIGELLAEFGILGEEFNYTDPDTNEMTKGADLRGNYFDLDQQADDKNWSDDERALVAKVLMRNAAKNAGEYRLHTAPVLHAPWPTYDKTHHNQLPVLAAQLGLLPEALAYERQTKKRESVIEKYEEELGKQAAADDLVAA